MKGGKRRAGLGEYVGETVDRRTGLERDCEGRGEGERARGIAWGKHCGLEGIVDKRREFDEVCRGVERRGEEERAWEGGRVRLEL